MAPLKCTVCNKRNASPCRTCLSAAYCSTACQINDMPFHNLLCRQFLAFRNSKRPSATAKIAISFPMDSNQPQLIWYEYDRTHETSFEAYAADGITLLVPFGADGDDGHEKYIDPENEVAPGFARYIDDHMIKIRFRDAFFFDGSTVNMCIESVMDGELNHTWKGPLVAFCQNGAEFPQGERDITLADFRVVLEFFKVHSCGRIT